MIPTDPPKGLLDLSDEPFEEVPDEGDDGKDSFVGPLPSVDKGFDDRLTTQQQEIKGLRARIWDYCRAWVVAPIQDS